MCAGGDARCPGLTPSSVTGSLKDQNTVFPSPGSQSRPTPGASAKNRGTGFVFILNAPSLLFGGGGLLLRDVIPHGSGCSRTGGGLVVSVLGPSPPRTRFLVDVFLFCLLLYPGTVRGSP